MKKFRQEFEGLRVALLVDRMAKSSQVATLAERRYVAGQLNSAPHCRRCLALPALSHCHAWLLCLLFSVILSPNSNLSLPPLSPSHLRTTPLLTIRYTFHANAPHLAYYLL